MKIGRWNQVIKAFPVTLSNVYILTPLRPKSYSSLFTKCFDFNLTKSLPLSQVGLAVGDIDNIQKNATMDRYVMQASVYIKTF